MINIFLGRKSDDYMSCMLKDLKSRYIDGMHYIFVVPDRCSVLCEKMIFEELDIESTCDIEVLTLSRLSSRLFPNFSVISKNTSVMIMQRVLLENRDRLCSFKSNLESELASLLFGTISQFKSCKVDIDSIAVQKGNKVLQDKLSDIALLYKSYQDILKQNHLLDSMDRLNMITPLIKDSELINNSIFYVGLFDGFTIQGYEIISAIMKYSKEFNIGLTSTDNPNNLHIYDEGFINKIKDLAPNANIVYCQNQDSGYKKHLIDNLFSLSPSTIKLDSEDISLFEGANFEEEVINCASTIRLSIKEKGYRMSDFFVAIPSLDDKKDIVERVFDDFGLKFYIDCQENFSNSALFRLISQFLNMAMEKYSTSSMLSFLNNPLLSLDSQKVAEFKDYIRFFGLSSLSQCKSFNVDNISYDGYREIRDYILHLVDSVGALLGSATCFGDYIQAVQQLMVSLNVDGLLQGRIEKYNSRNDEKLAMLFSQYIDIFQDILQGIDTLKSYPCSLKDFILALLTGAKNSMVATVPISIDAIFVGDSSKSFFESRKEGYILGACEGEFPIYNADIGVITDNDIGLVSDKYRLEPTIRQINRKERFKCFELLLKAKDHLHLSYNYDKGRARSEIFSDIQSMFTVNQHSDIKKIKIKKYSDLGFVMQNCAPTIAKRNLIKSIRQVLDRAKDKSDNEAILYNTLDLPSDFLASFYKRNNLKLKNDSFFRSRKSSISEIERYMKCPFMHFMDYGLRIKERVNSTLDNRVIGSIMHSFVENLLKTLDLPVSDEVLVDTSQRIFDKVAGGEEFSHYFYSPSNKVLYNNLLKEAHRLSIALNCQAKNSDFKPKYLETRYDDNGIIKSLKIKTKKGIISLVGKIDRIDVFEDYFRVIDYKTGSVSYSLDELFFGGKVQLEAYIKVVENSLKLKVAGSYYFPVKNELKKDIDNSKKYQLKGRTVDNSRVIYASDKSLSTSNKSNIIEVYYKGEGNKEYASSSKVVEEKEMNALSTYALNLIKRAIDDIQTLDISPRPLLLNSTDACSHCKYGAVCRFDTSFGNIKRMVKGRIDITSFAKEEE